MKTLLAKLRRLFRRKPDLAEELDTHLQFEIEAAIERGLSPEEARADAARAMGNRTRIEERSREEWTFSLVEQVRQDFFYAIRSLLHAQGFALTAVSVLALGIGVNLGSITSLTRRCFIACLFATGSDHCV